jgi:hypothetical protein
MSHEELRLYLQTASIMEWLGESMKDWVRGKRPLCRVTINDAEVDVEVICHAVAQHIARYKRHGCAVHLAGEGEPILVCGQMAPGTTGATYRVLDALARAFPAGLTRQELNEKSGALDARGLLRDLLRREPWKTAQPFSNTRGTRGKPARYSIRGAA